MSDPREIFANGRVAHQSLQGQVDSTAFVTGTKMRVAKPVLGIFASPNAFKLERQAIYGDPVTVLEIDEGFAFGRCESNGYCGYLPEDGLADWAEPTHKVAARSSFGFKAPDIKSPDPIALSFGSRLVVVGEDNGLVKTADGFYMPKSHLASASSTSPDLVATARLFMGVPYLWGGNSAFGVDCSGLVQAAFHAAGLPCPGDSDQQAKMDGNALDANDRLSPGDLLFWVGHVAMVSAPDQIIHANGHHMAVVEEDLGAAVHRISKEAGPITRRLRVNRNSTG